MTVGISIFKAPETDEEAGSILASHMPQGKAWDKKNDPESNMNGLVKGFSADSMLVQQKIYEMAQEFDINITTDLLPDWETSVGIPDDCIYTIEDIEIRRERIIQRLRNIPIVTLSDLQEYINFLFPDDTIIIKTGAALASFEYEFEVGLLGDIDEKFVIIAEVQTETPVFGSEFEYEFEFEFTGGPNTSTLMCILRNVVPANVVIIINYIEV